MPFLAYSQFPTWLRRTTACFAVIASLMTTTSLNAAFCNTGANSGNLIGSCGFEPPTTTPWTTLSGSYSVSTANLAPNGDTQNALLAKNTATTLTQAISGLTAGVTYNLTFQYVFSTSLGSPTFTYQLKDASNNNIKTVNLAITDSWLTVTDQFTAPTVGLPISIYFNLSNNTGGGRLDNVIVTAVPEPTTMILLGSLCSAVVGYKWKKKQSLVS
jgi:hypothetical protein